MKVIWNRDAEDLEINGIHFKVWCHVRNEIDPKYIRRLHDPNEVVFAIVNGVQTKIPYMPRKFPKGTFEIITVEFVPKTDQQKDFWPVKIRTNASQDVEVWELDENKGYKKGTGKFVRDGGLLIHYSWSNTTLGCGREESEIQVRKLAQMIIDGFSTGRVFLEVV